jgi:hypothetical protein
VVVAAAEEGARGRFGVRLRSSVHFLEAKDFI